MQLSKEIFDVAVVGAGPSGLAILAELLHQRPSLDLAWIDEDFTSAGRLSCYPRVPSNTKVELFVRYYETIRRILPMGRDVDECIGDLRRLDPQSRCYLQNIATMVRSLVERCLGSLPISSTRGKAETVRINQFGGKCAEIDVRLLNDEMYMLRARTVVLATGSHPKSLLADTSLYYKSIICLDDALDPLRLKTLISENDAVYVYGNSHSAILVMKNVCELGARPICVYKRPPRYAIYQENSPQIIYDNTGLKGTAAEWCRQNWHGMDKICISGGGKGDDGTEIIGEMSSDAKVVFAIGFERNDTICVEYKSAKLRQSNLERVNGPRLGQDSCIPRLYGVGIAFPGTDVYEYEGQVIEEESVGLFKFCRHSTKDAQTILEDLDRMANHDMLE